MLADRMGAPRVTIGPVHDQEDNDCDGDESREQRALIMMTMTMTTLINMLVNRTGAPRVADHRRCSEW